MRRQLGLVLAKSAGIVLRRLFRIARQLFHETTGSLFVLFALIGGVGAWREWHRGAAQWLIALSIAFALMMAVFAVSSFRSARRVR